MERPEIICHMMSSVDGRLLTDRYTEPFDGRKKEDFYDDYYRISREFGADAWIVGRKTMQEEVFPKTFDHADFPRAVATETWHGKDGTGRYAVVLDPKGKILYEDNKFDGDNIITILGEGVSEEYLSHLRGRGISYMFAGPEGNDLTLAMKTLKDEFGIGKMLLEGGGITNGHFLNARLIDRLSLLVYPGLDGLGGMPTIFEYSGDAEMPAADQTLEFIKHEVLPGGLVWLCYDFHHKP